MTRLETENILGLGKGKTLRNVTDDYILGRVLGKGAFGTVRLATHKGTGRTYACKSISKSKLVSGEDVEEVQREVAILNHVAGHQNVVASKASYEDKQNVHIIMELCMGGELFDSIIRSGKYTEKKAAEVFKKMVSMLHHCHELGVMHRDLKPENFLLTDSDADKAEIKVTDFGLSTFFKQEDRMTQQVGSPYYVAPEVLRADYSYHADIWSLGVILYILLSGLPPFWGNTDVQVFKMILKGEVDFKTNPWPKISDAAKDLVHSLLQTNPANRPTCSEILRHPWLQKEGQALDRPLDNVVLKRMKKFAAINKLKKTALMVVGECLSAEEIAGMQKLFQNIDRDASGTITVKELQDAIKQWGHKIPTEEVMAIVSDADVDANGVIDYNEFVAATINVNQLEKEELIFRAFQEIDVDRSNSISLDELEQAFQKFGVQDDTQGMLELADKNGDGHIDYAEFVTLMRETKRELRSFGGPAGPVFRRSQLGLSSA